MTEHVPQVNKPVLVGEVPTSPQAWLDRLVATSLAGGFPAMQGITCAYRTTDGRACVIGLLIPDDQYQDSIEGRCVETLIFDGRFIPPQWATKYQLEEVQGIHDNRYRWLSLNEKWNHDLFVKELLKCSVFGGLTPTKH